LRAVLALKNAVVAYGLTRTTQENPMPRLAPCLSSTPTLALLSSLLAVLVIPARGAAQTTPQDWRLTVDVSPLTHPEPGGNGHPTVEDRVRLLFFSDELDCHTLVFGPPHVEDGVIRVEASREYTNIEPCSLGRGARSHWEVTLEPLSEPGVYTVEAYLKGQLLLSEPLEVWPPARGLLFRGGGAGSRHYFLEVRAFLTDPRVVSGSPREAASVRLTPDSGYYWFFDSDNVEVTVKVLDGRAVNGRIWLFVTGMTDLGLTVEAHVWGSCGGGPCPTHRYVNKPGSHLVVVDGIAPPE
jgi:hypothetical protein